jgi:hypothetical protein
MQLDEATKNLLQTVAIGAVQKVLMAGAAGLAAHGISAEGTNTQLYAGLATLIVTVGISFYRDYGRAIIISQLELLKARSVAAAAKLHEAGVPAVTTAEIAAASPTLTEKSVTKIADTLPAPVKASVIPNA